MELSVLKHIVLTSPGSQGATQGPKHQKSKFSVPPPPQPPPRSIGPSPKGRSAALPLGLKLDLRLMTRPYFDGEEEQGM